ncbi:MAG: transposase [Bacteroidota bacterium]
MRANVKLLKKCRRYSEDFKRGIVSDFESGKYSVLQLERLHGVGNVTIYNWIYKYSTFNKKGYRVVESNQSSDKEVQKLRDQIKELERKVGQKQIKIDYLEKMIELADQEFDIQIKKNSNTPPSAGSENTQSK